MSWFLTVASFSTFDFAIYKRCGWKIDVISHAFEKLLGSPHLCNLLTIASGKFTGSNIRGA
jgi:hypothetical protein